MEETEMKWNRRIALMSVLVLSLMCVALSAQIVSAADLNITLSPGETARVPMKFWCLDFGKPFPAAVSGPGSRAPDAVVKVLDSAIASGLLASNPYQTQLAIWKAADGTFHDTGTEGHAVADQIMSDSAKLNLPAIASGASTLDQLVSQGVLKTTVENFTAVTDTARNNQQPFMGTGILVIQNSSSQKVSFVLVEGAIFKPAAGANAQTTTGTTEQTLVSHQDTQKPPELPTTGGTASNTSIPLIVVMLLGGIGLLVGARLLKSRSL